MLEVRDFRQPRGQRDCASCSGLSRPASQHESESPRANDQSERPEWTKMTLECRRASGAGDKSAEKGDRCLMPRAPIVGNYLLPRQSEMRADGLGQRVTFRPDDCTCITGRVGRKLVRTRKCRIELAEDESDCCADRPRSPEPV
ncbi:unnamed protein product [Protopolystoma xenopodis]|uniref:Uncharacterized protein n=1 Tax=Protopolystoma xenopodis TaxID=117903 RepID=A0A448XMZ7_9PLAT|nr:unnamed protein product [Protopolystoma xenopodis]